MYTVVVGFKGVGNEPIVGENMFKGTATSRFSVVIQFLLEMLRWKRGKPSVRYRIYDSIRCLICFTTVPLVNSTMPSRISIKRVWIFQSGVSSIRLCVAVCLDGGLLIVTKGEIRNLYLIFLLTHILTPHLLGAELSSTNSEQRSVVLGPFGNLCSKILCSSTEPEK